MRTRAWILGVALVASSVFAGDDKKPTSSPSEPTVGTKVGQRIPQFEVDAWNLNGEKPVKSTHDSHKLERPTAYVFMSRTCPYCDQYRERLAKMGKSYGEKGLDFVMVYPTRKTPQEKKIEYHKSSKFTTAFVNDKEASIAWELNVKKTPEIVLVDKKGVIVFRGGIDDNPRSADKAKKHYLKNACDETLSGKKVTVTSAPLYG